MEIKNLTIEDVIEKLSNLKPPITLKADAIRMYSKYKLAPCPLIKGDKGRGKKTIYPPETPIEIAASYTLIKRYPGNKKQIADAREIALYAEKFESMRHNDLYKDELLRLMIGGKLLAGFFAGMWLKEKLVFLEQISPLPLTLSEKMDAVIIEERLKVPEDESMGENEKSELIERKKILEHLRLGWLDYAASILPMIAADVQVKGVQIKVELEKENIDEDNT